MGYKCNKERNKDWVLTSNKHYTEITSIDHTETANSSLEISDPVCLTEHVLSGCQWQVGREKGPFSMTTPGEHIWIFQNGKWVKEATFYLHGGKKLNQCIQNYFLGMRTNLLWSLITPNLGSLSFLLKAFLEWGHVFCLQKQKRTIEELMEYDDKGLQKKRA